MASRFLLDEFLAAALVESLAASSSGRVPMGLQALNLLTRVPFLCGAGILKALVPLRRRLDGCYAFSAAPESACWTLGVEKTADRRFSATDGAMVKREVNSAGDRMYCNGQD